MVEIVQIYIEIFKKLNNFGDGVFVWIWLLLVLAWMHNFFMFWICLFAIELNIFTVDAEDHTHFVPVLHKLFNMAHKRMIFDA